jgi:protein-S-isoprenylcysteine O-methyltransferase Ste14
MAGIYYNILLLIWFALLVYWVAALLYELATHKIKRTTKRKSWGTGLLLFIFLLVMFSPIGFTGPLEILFIHEHVSLKIIGLIVAALGIGFAIVARSYLGSNWSGVPSIKKGHELVTSGPYSIVRHPIYTGILFAAIGTVILLGTVGSLLILAFVIIFVWLRIRAEEKLMIEQFKKSYQDYRKKVKAIIPWIL